MIFSVIVEKAKGARLMYKNPRDTVAGMIEWAVYVFVIGAAVWFVGWLIFRSGIDGNAYWMKMIGKSLMETLIVVPFLIPGHYLTTKEGRIAKAGGWLLISVAVFILIVEADYLWLRKFYTTDDFFFYLYKGSFSVADMGWQVAGNGLPILSAVLIIAAWWYLKRVRRE